MQPPSKQTQMPGRADWSIHPADATTSRDSMQALEVVAKDSWARASGQQSPRQQQQQEQGWAQWAWKTLNTHFLFFGAVVVVAVAAAYPPFGRSGGPLMPSLTTGTIAVAVVFFTSGLTLRSSELADALLSMKFNAYVQLYSFVFIPAVVYVLAMLLREGGFDQKLVDGLIIMSCLPTSINMAVVLTKSAKGNESAAVLNCSAGNLLGIIVTPMLLLLLVKESSSVPIGETLLTLTYKMVVPLVAGQIVRYLPFDEIRGFINKNKAHLKRLSEIMLIAIIYTTFCNTFYDGVETSTEQLIGLLFITIALFIVFAALTWWSSGWACFGFSDADRACALFVCANKTAAVGIPLINTIYEGNANLGLYTVPLLLYYPCQLIIGSMLTGPVRRWIERRQAESTASQSNSPDQL